MGTDSADGNEARSSTGTATVGIGIFAHNEESTIDATLRGFTKQQVGSVTIDKILVVCCGCTDWTVPLVQKIAREDTRIELIVRQKREGKIAAINEFLQTATSVTLILASGDVIPAPDLVERLSSPLIDGAPYSMTGPRVMARHSLLRRRLVDRLHDILWRLHHTISLRSPKLGEIIAVRRSAIPSPLPEGVHCDEALIESLVAGAGGNIKYISSAVAYNFPPECISDFYRQRRRIAAQHIMLKNTYGYRPATMKPGLVAGAVWQVLRQHQHARSLVVLLCALEATARLHGRWDVVCGHDYRLWRVTRHARGAQFHVPNPQEWKERDFPEIGASR